MAKDIPTVSNNALSQNDYLQLVNLKNLGWHDGTNDSFAHSKKKKISHLLRQPLSRETETPIAENDKNIDGNLGKQDNILPTDSLSSGTTEYCVVCISFEVKLAAIF